MASEQEINIEPENTEQGICLGNEPIQVGGSPGGAVTSVNGKVGNVWLTTSDLSNTSGYQTASDVATAITSATTLIDARLDAVDAAIDSFSTLIPTQASTTNQLADKAFVNSSVSTNTANFVGTFNTIEELEAVQNPTNNDYGFVISTDADGNTVYNRYKYVASTTTWLFEYALNNSSFTAAQWTAVNSGITAALVQQISDNVNAISSLNTALSGKANTVDLATVATSGSYDDLTNKPTIPTPYTLPAATASTLGGVKVGDGLSVEEDGTISADGGGGGTLYNDLGQNTDGAMTQKAATDALFADGATATQVQIGAGAQSSGSHSVAIGDSATAAGSSIRQGNIAIGWGANATMSNGGSLGVAIGRLAQTSGGGTVAIGQNALGGRATVAIGQNARAASGSSNMVVIGAHNMTDNLTGLESVAIGYNASTMADSNTPHSYSASLGSWSKPSRDSEVSIGDGSSNANYGTRYLANVRAGTLDTDAINKKQLDDAIAALEARIAALEGS